MTRPTIGFAGLGAMGGGVAAHLVKQGYTVRGFDIATPLLDAFAGTGGTAVRTPREAATGAEFFISMVANAAQNFEVLFASSASASSSSAEKQEDKDKKVADSAIEGLNQGATIILLSTIAPADVQSIRERLDTRGRADVKFLDCPVSGGTVRAADGTLSIFASGPAADVAAAREVLRAMAGHLYETGALGNGSRTKTVHQLLAATNIIAASEAMGLAASVGLNTRAVCEKVGAPGSEGASFMFTNRAPHMLQEDEHVYSALGIILKDAGIVTETARRAQFPTPLADAAEQMYLQGVQAGLLRADDAKLVQLYLPQGQGDLVAVMAKADVMMTASHQVSADTIGDLLAGVHLAASIEAMAFCRALGMDRRTMCDVISNAAGASEMYVRCIPGMLEQDRWTLADCPQAADVGQRLSDAVDKCRKIKYPCPMAAMALQQFHFAALVGKTVKDEGRGGR